MAFKPSDAFEAEAPEAEDSTPDYGSLFAEDEGMGDPLTEALKSAGYDVSPDQIEQIKGILGGGEAKPFGGEETAEEEAAEAGSRPAAQNPFA